MNEFTTIHEQITVDRNRLRKAVNEQMLVVGQDKNGFIYEKATPEEIADYVMDLFAEYAYEWQKANNCACVFEDLLNEHHVKYTFREFMIRMHAKAAHQYDPEEED